MKDYNWKIKVADLLNNPGNTDIVSFKNKFLNTTDISLGKDGIKGNIFLQGLNQNEILVKIKEISFSVNYACDKCLSNFNKKYNLKNLEEVRFVNPENVKIKEEIHDTIFPIDMKNQTIDLSELIEIIVKIQKPFVKICKNCLNKEKSYKENFQEENNYYKFDFGKLLKS